MKEIITLEDYKIDTEILLNESQNRAGCSFWNTYYIYATGGSKSVALANLPDEIAFYSTGFNTNDISGCSKLGGVDVSCLLDNHACVASQAFCCN